MPDEKILRDKARAAVRDGKLPSRRPDRTWGGPGVGATCSVCDLPVERDEMECLRNVARAAPESTVAVACGHVGPAALEGPVVPGLH
jgi:hypothetical protein